MNSTGWAACLCLVMGKSKKVVVAETAIEVGAAVVGTAVGALSPPAGAATGVVLSRTGKAVFNRLFRRANSFGENVDAELGGNRLDELTAESDEAAEAVERGFWLSMQALEPAVVPVVERMTADYARRGARPDRAFKTLGELLVSCDADEFQGIQTIATGITGGGEAYVDPSDEQLYVKVEEPDLHQRFSLGRSVIDLLERRGWLRFTPPGGSGFGSPSFDARYHFQPWTRDHLAQLSAYLAPTAAT